MWYLSATGSRSQFGLGNGGTPMHGRSRWIAIVLFMALAAGAAAQTVTVGRLTGNFSGTRPEAVFTLIDLVNPAPLAGNLTTATVRWSNNGTAQCAGAFKVKIF